MDELSTLSPCHDGNDSRSDDVPAAAVVVDTMMHTAYAFMRHIQARLYEHDWAGDHRVSFARGRLLHVLFDKGSQRMGDVAAQLGVTARTLTTTVDALEREGLVIRKPDPTDRRAILLALGEGAHALMAQFHQVAKDAAEEFLSPLNTEERQQFFDLLNHLEQKDPSDYPDDEDPRHGIWGADENQTEGRRRVSRERHTAERGRNRERQPAERGRNRSRSSTRNRAPGAGSEQH